MTKMRQWTIFTVVAVLVVLVAGWLLLVKPQKSKASDLRSQTAAQQQANQLLLTQIASLQAEAKALPQQQLTLAKFTTEVPNDAAEPTLIRQLSTAANGAGVDLISITPGTAASVATAPAATTTAPTASSAGATSTPAPGAQSLTPAVATPALVELPLALGVTGSYANMVSFFQAVEKLPRAMLVSGWSMCRLASNSGSTQGGASCQAPSVPPNKTPATGTLGATLNTTVFYSPASATAPTTTTGSTGASTSPATTPSAAPSAAAS